MSLSQVYGLMKMHLRRSKRPLWITLSRRSFMRTPESKVCRPADQFSLIDQYPPAPTVAHKSNLCSITSLLANVTKITEAVQEELRTCQTRLCMLIPRVGVFVNGTIPQSRMFDFRQRKVFLLKYFTLPLRPSLTTSRRCDLMSRC